MSRSQMWSGAEWVSMTGGAGEGGGTEPGDDYLLLDGSNNNPPPNNYLRQSDGDARYLQLTGGTMTGVLVMANNSIIVSPTTAPVLLHFDNADGRVSYLMTPDHFEIRGRDGASKPLLKVSNGIFAPSFNSMAIYEATTGLASNVYIHPSGGQLMRTTAITVTTDDLSAAVAAIEARLLSLESP